MGGMKQQGERGIRKRVLADETVTYQIRVSRGRHTRTGTAPTLRYARELRSRFALELAEATDFPERRKTEPITLQEFASRYERDYLRVKASKSYRQAQNRLQNVVALLGPNRRVDAVTTGDVHRMLARLREKGDGPATCNRYLSRLNSAMKRAVVWGYARENPCAGVERLREPKPTDRYLHPHELAALLEAADPRIQPMILFAAHTGVRQGEQLALRWADVDLENRRVVIRSETSKNSEARTVPLNSAALRALSMCSPSDPVFGFETFPNKLWRKALRAVGWDVTEAPRLAGWCWHSLRHHCASQLAMADVPLTKVGKILGHRALVTTQRYAHLSDASLEDAVARIELDTSWTRGNVVPLLGMRKPA
jgi:integrase